MKRISWTLMMSLFAVFLYAAVPTNINDYTTYGITKTGGAENAHILDIKCTYVAYKVNSCSSGELCVVGLFNPTGTNKKISGSSSNSNYYGTNSHWLYSHYTKSGNYIFFDLQAVQKGIWLLGIIQSNAGDWYYYNKDIFTITVKSNNTAYGTVSGGGTYIKGTTATIKATPKTGYKFVKWSDNNTSATRTITVTANATYTATFESVQYTLYFDANGGLIPTAGKMGNTPDGYTTTLSDDKTTGSIVVTYDKSYFMTIIDDCPTRDGYIFEGWYTDPTAGEKVYDATGCCVPGNYWTASNNWCYTADVHLYAHWREKQTEVPIGAINGLFSVSDSTKIFFSQGNLQYNATLGTHQCADGTTQQGSWRFAEHQWDYVGDGSNGTVYANDVKCSNTLISSTYSGWIDLFGWGTSGWNSGANCYQPYSVSDQTSDYYPGGISDSDLTGNYANSDWGVYNIIDSNVASTWRTLMYNEWNYLYSTRENASSKRGLAIVNNVNGYIFLPDNWEEPNGITFIANTADEKDNNYSTEEWFLMESAGAIFLPFGGHRYSGTTTHMASTYGYYWTSTHAEPSSVSRAWRFLRDDNGVRFAEGGRISGSSVRLVRNVARYTITFINYDDIVLEQQKWDEGSVPTYTGMTPTKPADAEYTYIFVGWEPEVTEVNGDTTYTAKFYGVKNIYEITWLNDDGRELAKDSLEYGILPEYTGEAPTKEETESYIYTFAGWTPEVTAVTGDAIYTAVFDSTKVVYSIDVNVPDTIEAHGSVVIDGTPTYGETITLTPVPEDGYEFDYWSDGNTDNPREIVVDGDVNVYPIFVKKQYLIRFVNYDNFVLQRDSLEHGTMPEYTEATPEKPASAKYTYSFKEWQPAIVEAISDATYTAQFDSTLIEYEIHVTPEGGSTEGGSVDVTGTPTYGETVILTPQHEDGYVFDHWSDGNTDNPREVVVDGDVNVYPIFVKKQYLIRFVNFDGSVLQRDSLEHGTMPEYTETAPEKPASAKYTYSFKEWQPAIVAAISDATYTAQFDSTLIEYEIHVTPEGGSTEGGSVDVTGTPTYGETITLTPVPEDGYVFEGWSDGNTDNPREVVVDGDVNIYPIFHKCEEVITLTEIVIGKGESYDFGGKTYSTRGVYYDTIVLANGCDSISTLKLSVVKKKTFNLRAVVDSTQMAYGTAIGSGIYNDGQTVTIEAIPASSKYVFARWWNPDEGIEIFENPYTFTLTRNLTVKAVFKRARKRIVVKQQGASYAMSHPETDIVAVIEVGERTAMVNNTSESTYRIYDSAGHLIIISAEDNTYALPSGLYFIHIDGESKKFIIL